jgi:hypothetical protein
MVGNEVESAFSDDGEVALELGDTRPELEAEEDEEFAEFMANVVRQMLKNGGVFIGKTASLAS